MKIKTHTHSIQSRLRKAIKLGYSEIVKKFIKKGVDLGQPDKNGKYPLMLAIESVSFPVLKIITDMENIEENTKVGGFVAKICYNMQMEQIKIIEMLIHAGADVNMPDKDGKIPLKAAIETGNRKIVLMLLATKKINITTLGDLRVLANLIKRAAKNKDLEIMQGCYNIQAVQNILTSTDSTSLPKDQAKPASATATDSLAMYKLSLSHGAVNKNQSYPARNPSP